MDYFRTARFSIGFLVALLLVSCANITKTSEYSGQGFSEKFEGVTDCPTVKVRDGFIQVRPANNGRTLMTGPLFIPLIPTSFSWDNKVESIAFEIRFFRGVETSSFAQVSSLKHWKLYVDGKRVRSRKIIVDELDPNHSALLKFKFKPQTYSRIKLLYKNKRVLRLYHKRALAYSVLSVYPSVSYSCTPPIFQDMVR